MRKFYIEEYNAMEREARAKILARLAQGFLARRDIVVTSLGIDPNVANCAMSNLIANGDVHQNGLMVYLDKERAA